MGQQEPVTFDNAVINLTILEKNRRRGFKLNENVIMIMSQSYAYFNDGSDGAKTNDLG